MRRIVLTMMLIMGLQTAMAQDFVRVENGQFIRHGKPYHYVGTNFWYGAVLGSKGQGGDRARLAKELDYLKSIGVDNLRVWFILRCRRLQACITTRYWMDSTISWQS